MPELKLHLARTFTDIHFLYEARRHPEVDNMLSGNPPSSMKQHLEYLETVQDKTRWIYVASVGEKLVGYSQVYDVTEDTVEIGFVVHPEEQGKGYGKGLVLQTISKAKEKFPDKKVILYVLRENPKAIHIYKKLGFIEKELPSTDEDTLGMELSA